MKFNNLPAAEIAKVQHQEAVVQLAIQTLNSMRVALDLAPVHLHLAPVAEDGSPIAGGIDVQANGYKVSAERVAILAEADRMSKEAQELWAEAERLRSQFRLQLVITQSPGDDGQFSLDLRIFGAMHALYAPRGVEEVCQNAFYLMQGFQPPLPRKPFGTRLDGKETGLYTAADSLFRNQ